MMKTFVCYLRGREASCSNANVCWHTMANKRDGKLDSKSEEHCIDIPYHIPLSFMQTGNRALLHLQYEIYARVLIQLA